MIIQECWKTSGRIFNMPSPVFEKIVKILNHPASGVVLDATTGASIGSIAGSLMYHKEYEKLQDIMKSKENNIDAKEYVAKYAPDLATISTKKDAEKSNLGTIDKWLLKQMIPDNGKWDNAFYIPNKETSAVAVPKKVNQYILGHELGHHKDMKGVNPGILTRGNIGLITGKLVDSERAAWEKSPIEIDEKGKEVQDLALGSYENLQKYVRIGFGLGLAASAAKLFGPKVLDAIRGNIR